jgi:hypothetical protein
MTRMKGAPRTAGSNWLLFNKMGVQIEQKGHSPQPVLSHNTWRCRDFRLAVFATLLGVCCSANAAQAETLTLLCERENALVTDWNGKMTITYSGGPNGEMSVASEHVAFTVPATQSERSGVLDAAEVKAVEISGSGEAMSIMPDPRALVDCARSSIQPEFKDDPDMQALALAGCVPRTAPSSLPIAIHANVVVGLIPGPESNTPDVIVEIKRSYLDATENSGRAINIETFPQNCALAAQ